jgi:dihydroorotate dehydrogenase (NAD+) catalytic subunit
MTDMRVNLAGIELKNPVITASGTFGYGMEYNEFYPISRLGGISCKGTTLKPREGNLPSRIAETPSGMLNSVGLQNPGIDSLLSVYLPWLVKQNTVVIANIAGNTIEEYCEMAERLSDSAVHMIELNISCPNVKHGGVNFGTSCDSVAEVTAEVKKRCKKPLMVKLTPNVTNIGDIAAAAEASGADALSLINTLTGMRIDIRTRRPILHNNTGGLSGAAVFPVAVRMVRDVYKRVSVPVVGMGGISTWQDAAEMMIAGASAVQIGTANFRDPFAAVKVIDGLQEYADTLGLGSIQELTGTLSEWE